MGKFIVNLREGNRTTLGGGGDDGGPLGVLAGNYIDCDKATLTLSSHSLVGIWTQGVKN